MIRMDLVSMAGEPVRKNGRQPSVQALQFFRPMLRSQRGRQGADWPALVLKEGAEEFSHKSFTVR
jgi:hypothetical protein